MRTIIFLALFCLSFTAKAVSLCYGDNDMSAGSCFKGIALNTGTRFAWAYVTGSGFWNSDARITTYADNGNASPPPATWNFKTPVKGDVWFSVWIPSKNATARIVYYTASCYGPNGSGYGRTLKNIDQLNYSAQWVTIGNVGTLPAGSSCYVTASKYLTNAEIRNGGQSSTKMAIDGMKMSIY